MPGGTGLDWLRQQRRKGLYADTTMITAYADLQTAIAALQTGESVFVLKPFRANQILSAAARTLEAKNLHRDNALLRRELPADIARGQLFGTSKALADVRILLTRLAPLPTPVLFTGESGTGKELAARHLHRLSDRSEAPFVPVNCAALAPDRIADELFGRVDAEGKLRPGLFFGRGGNPVPRRNRTDARPSPSGHFAGLGRQTRAPRWGRA